MRYTKADILRYFCRYPIMTLPIVTSKSKKLVGILSKSDIIASSGTTSDISTPANKVINHHIIPVNTAEDFQILQTLWQNYRKIDKLPVIDKSGKLVGYWGKYELISAWEGYPAFTQRDWDIIFAALELLIIIVDNDGKICYINPWGQKELEDRKPLINRSITKKLPELPQIDESPKSKIKLSLGKDKMYEATIAPLVKDDAKIGGIYILNKI